VIAKKFWASSKLGTQLGCVSNVHFISAQQSMLRFSIGVALSRLVESNPIRFPVPAPHAVSAWGVAIRVQKITLICPHMPRIPLSVKSRLRKRPGPGSAIAFAGT